jgi:hypothetical protein
MNGDKLTLTAIKLKPVRNEIIAAQKVIFDEMRKQYPSMNLGDIQSIAMFMKMFEEKFL